MCKFGDIELQEPWLAAAASTDFLVGALDWQRLESTNPKSQKYSSEAEECRQITRIPPQEVRYSPSFCWSPSKERNETPKPGRGSRCKAITEEGKDKALSISPGEQAHEVSLSPGWLVDTLFPLLVFLDAGEGEILWVWGPK